jgi:uncharacterized membrane protein
MKHSCRLNQFRHIVPVFLCIVAVLCIVYFSILKIHKFNNFDPTCYHIGWISHSSWKLFTEGLFEFPRILLSKTPVIFLAPIILFAFFLPPYPELLLILQAILMTFAVFPLFLLANQILKSRLLALAFSISYLLHPFTHFGIMSGFCPDIILLPAIFFAIYFLEKGTFGKSLLFIVLANISRISMVAINMLWGLCLIFSKKNKRYGKIIFLFNLAWIAFITVCVFFLKTSTHLISLFHLEQYGNSFSGAIQTIFRIPILVQNLLKKENLIILSNVYIPFSFMPLFQPLFLLPLIFSFGYIFFVHNDTSELCFILPFIYLSAIYGSEKFINLLKYKNMKYILSGLILILSVISHHYLHLPWQDTRGPIFLSMGSDHNYYKITEHSKIGHKFLKMIPKTASVIAQYPLNQHLARRSRLDLFSRKFEDENWEYIFLDVSAPPNFMSPPNYRQKVSSLLTGDIYGVMAYEDGWLLLKRNYSSAENKGILLRIQNSFSSH